MRDTIMKTKGGTAMQLRTLLEIRHGLTAIIGGGGKTTLLYALAKECSMDARVIVCTTTHILKPSHLPCVLSGGEAEIQAALEENSCVCVGTKSETGKFGAPAISFERLLQLADYVFVEADGSKHLPLKAHAGHEPVVPKEANQTILVLGVSGLGRPIREVAHRPVLYAEKLGVTEDAIVTPELAARLLERCTRGCLSIRWKRNTNWRLRVSWPGIYTARSQRGRCKRRM